MPLHKTITIDSDTRVYVWNITEDFDTLFHNTPLRDVHLARLEKMLSKTHQCGFLSVRHLLQAAGYSDMDLYYDENGKPGLADGKYISISHSFQFSAIIISSKNVGIDIEKQRDKIARIADKFVGTEAAFLDINNNYIQDLSIIWGAKESLYKMCNSRSLSFKQDMHIHKLMDHSNDLTAHVDCRTMNFSMKFECHYLIFDGYTLVYAIENKM